MRHLGRVINRKKGPGPSPRESNVYYEVTEGKPARRLGRRARGALEEMGDGVTEPREEEQEECVGGGRRMRDGWQRL